MVAEMPLPWALVLNVAPAAMTINAEDIAAASVVFIIFAPYVRAGPRRPYDPYLGGFGLMGCAKSHTTEIWKALDIFLNYLFIAGIKNHDLS